MSTKEYKPDNWIVFEFKGPDNKLHRKVLAGWSGSYLDGSSWKVNSGIKNTTQDNDYLYFEGYSGSVYKCNKKCYGIRMNNAHVWEQIQKQGGVKEVTVDQLHKELDSE